MAIKSNDCFVIHSRPFSDSRLIVQLFTPDLGVISALYRLPSKKYTFRPKPFEPLIVHYRGQSQLKTITSLEPTATAIHLKGQRLFCGLYVNELIERLLRVQENCEAIFYLYHSVITHLSIHDNYVSSLRLFELNLLEHLGYAPDYNYDTNGEKIEDSHLVYYLYEPTLGFKRISHLKNSINTFTGHSIAMLSIKDLYALSEHTAIKRFTRLALQPLLGVKPLKARSLFN